jgi:hypothetical protein
VPKLREVMQELFPEKYENCGHAMRHKTFMVAPEILMGRGINVHEAVNEKSKNFFLNFFPYYLLFHSLLGAKARGTHLIISGRGPQWLELWDKLRPSLELCLCRCIPI